MTISVARAPVVRQRRYHRHLVEGPENIDVGGDRLLESGADLVTEGDAPKPPSNLTSKAAKGFLWALVGFIGIQVGSYATYTVASRILGPAQIGLIGALLTIVFWIDVFLDTGLAASIIYEQEQGQTHRTRVAFTMTGVMSLTATLVVLIGAPLLARFFDATHDVALFRLLAIVVAVKGMNQVPSAILRRDLDFRKSTIVSLAQSSLRFVVAVGLLVAGHGVVGMLIGIIASEVANTSLTWMFVRFRPHIAFDRVVTRELFRYGLPVFGSTLIGMLWLNGDYLVVGSHFGAKSTEFGNYYTAFRLPELVLGSLYNIFSKVAFPTYAAARAAGPEKLKEASLRSLRLLCLMGFTAGVGMALVASDFIDWQFPSFEGAIVPMMVLCVAGGFVGVGFASGDLYNAIGRQRLGLIFNLVGTPILFVGFLIAVPHGIVAVAAVHVGVMVPYAFVRIGVANHLIGTTWAQSLKALVPSVVAVVGMLAAALPVRMLVDTGLFRLAGIIVAGGLGSLIGVMLGARSTFGEFRDLVMKAAGR